MGYLTNTVYAMDPNNSVIKGLWCNLVKMSNIFPVETKVTLNVKSNPYFFY